MAKENRANEGYFTSIDGSWYETEYYNDAVNYNEYYDTLDEFLSDSIIGIYEDKEGREPIYKREVRTYLPSQNTYGYITTVGILSHDDITNKYNFRTVGVLQAMPVENTINDVVTALGATIDNSVVKGRQLEQDIKDKTQEFFNNLTEIPTIVYNDNGTARTVIDNDYIEMVHGLLVGEIKGDISKEYNYELLVYPNTRGVIIPNNKDFNSCYTGLANDGLITNAISKGQLDYLVENNDTVKNIYNNADIVSIFKEPSRFPGDVRYYIWGYNVNNNEGVFSIEPYDTRCQIFVPSSGVTRLMGYTYDNGVEGSEMSPSRSEFYTRPHSYTVAHVGVIVDSIGYAIYDNYVNPLPSGIPPKKDTTVDTNYIEWKPITPIFRPYTVNTIVQNWDGIPDVNIDYPLPPIINRPKIEDVEIPAPPTNITIPHNSDYGLFTIYLPSNSIMEEVTEYLWSDFKLEKLLNIFKNNPMDAVISLHEVYLSGQTIDSIKETTPKKVYFGNVEMTDSNSDWTKQRYLELNMGAMPIKLEFNDYRDYQRDISIFLPFIGFQSLDIMDFTGKGTTNIELKYICDILTGDVIANLYISKDGLSDNKFMYTWSGNMSSVLPLSANDKSRLFSNVGSAIGGVATAIATGGGSIIPSLIGGATSVGTGSQSSIQRSGSISGNIGAMNYKRAFILINNPRPLDVSYDDISGFTTNLKTRLSALTGYARVKECHVDTIPNASDTEKDMIMNMLKDGVIY